MTDRERDAPRRSPDEDTDEYMVPLVAPEEEAAEEEPADDAPAKDVVDDGDDEDGEEEPFASDIAPEADEETREPTAATPTGGASRLRLAQRLGRGQATPTTAPLVSPSERAVRIDDRTSQVFVVGVIATFVGIVLFAMLWGAGGFFTTPRASPSPSPSATVSASASPSSSLQPSAASPSGPATSSAPPSASPAGS